MSNPEDALLQTILDLENDPLICPLCTQDWHGLGNAYCPGAWASDAEAAAFFEHKKALAPLHIWVHRPMTLLEQQYEAIVHSTERWVARGSKTLEWAKAGLMVVPLHERLILPAGHVRLS